MTYTLDEVIEMAERTDKLIERSEFHKDATEYLKQYREMRWHYPSKGELPTEGETVLVAFQEGGPWYFTDAEYHEGGWASAVDLGYIVAWMYIIPPKEEA